MSYKCHFKVTICSFHNNSRNLFKENSVKSSKILGLFTIVKMATTKMLQNGLTDNTMVEQPEEVYPGLWKIVFTVI